MRYFSTFLSLAALFFGPFFNISHAADSSPEFEQFAQIAQATADRQGATILVQYDAEKRLLHIAREFKVNQYRKMTQVQSVKIDDLEPTAELGTSSVVQDPWLKIHCINKKKQVQLDSTQEINNVLDEDLTKQERLALLTLPCHPSELKKLADAYARFRQSVATVKK
jgi:hypothetical protein